MMDCTCKSEPFFYTFHKCIVLVRCLIMAPDDNFVELCSRFDDFDWFLDVV
jgi:hypothetical protein